MPNHVEVWFFLSIKASSNRVAQAAHEHEPPEDRIGLANDLGNNKDDQPAHDQVKSETELFIDFFGKDFVENTKDGGPPLDQDNAVAHPVVQQGEDNWCVTACDRNVDHGMVDNTKHILLR